ncbi:MAG: transglycosylase SLT domain-containing protein, partial [Acetobacteraceae bacterium]
PTKALAVATVADLQAMGVQSIDVGCMQINLMYHPAAFRSLDQAFDPHANARYAARFLTVLYDRTGDWTQAAGAYHSQTPTLGASYRARVLARWHPPPGVVRRYADFRPREAIYGDFRGARAAYADFSGASITETAGAGAAGQDQPAVPGRSGGGF